MSCIVLLHSKRNKNDESFTSFHHLLRYIFYDTCGRAVMKSCALAFLAASSTCAEVTVPCIPSRMLSAMESSKSTGSWLTTPMFERYRFKFRLRKHTPSNRTWKYNVCVLFYEKKGVLLSAFIQKNLLNRLIQLHSI